MNGNEFGTMLDARPAGSGTKRRLGYLGLTCTVGVLLVSGAAPPSAPPDQSEMSAPRLAAAGPPTAPKPQAAPMDEPLRLITEARKSYQDVRDYACLLVKRERIRGQMQPESVIVMKVRNKPFSVYLRWQGPKAMAGQEACFVEGKNDGKMRVHTNGILGAVGWVSLDLNDPRIRQNSNHSINEAGIGKLIERMVRSWTMEKEMNVTRVSIAEYEYNNRRCTRVQTMHPDNRSGKFVSYRTVMYFDKENHLPIRIETYDWPRQGGPADGDMMEVYSFVNLQLSVGLGDDVFNH
jgi:hypothetical protein